MANTRPYDPAFANRIVELASGGLFRNEIAQALGANDDDFAAWSSQHPEFAVALADADTAAGAWWDRQAREGMANNKPFRATLWAKVMAQHYGRAGHLPRKPADRPAARPIVRARYEIPDNGRRRRKRKAEAEEEG
jgi:hypothetical protein